VVEAIIERDQTHGDEVTSGLWKTSAEKPLRREQHCKTSADVLKPFNRKGLSAGVARPF